MQSGAPTLTELRRSDLDQWEDAKSQNPPRFYTEWTSHHEDRQVMALWRKKKDHNRKSNIFYVVISIIVLLIFI